jgi:hypothetical protein
MEILFVLMLGLWVLGSTRLHTMPVHVAAGQSSVRRASCGFKSQPAAELDATQQEGETDDSYELAGDK